VEPVLKMAPNSGGVSDDGMADIARAVVGIIRRHHIVGVWSNDVAQNNMRNSIDDYFFDVVRDKKRHEHPTGTPR
jgi:type I restriction enzyme, R subunit